MRYTLLIYENQADFEKRTGPEAEAEAYWSSWTVYSQALVDAGVFVSGAGLQPPETGTTLRLDATQRRVQDGPYAETKEQLGGLFVIDVVDLDAALDWAARCPTAMTGGVVEVRPAMQPKE